MKVIKECQDVTFQGAVTVTTTTCYLRSDRMNTLKTLTDLFNEAKKDFPTLNASDVHINCSRRKNPVVIGGKVKSMPGPYVESISFKAPAVPPKSYKRLPPTGVMQG